MPGDFTFVSIAPAGQCRRSKLFEHAFIRKWLDIEPSRSAGEACGIGRQDIEDYVTNAYRRTAERRAAGEIVDEGEPNAK